MIKAGVGVQQNIEDTAVCRDLFENANDLIQSVDENGKFLYVNKKWRDVLGYTEEEARRMAFPDIIHQSHLQACFSLFAELKKGKSFDNVRTQFVTKSGRAIDVDGNISVRMEDGKFIFTWGIFREAVSHSEIEKTLRQEQKFSQALIDSLPSVFYVVEVLSLRVVRWNRALIDVFGFSNEETAKMSPIDFIDEQDKKKVEGAIRRIIAQGKDTVEALVRAKEGQQIPYFFSAVYTTITDKGYIVGIGIDITDLRKREKDLARANAALKIRDEQITKEHELNRAKSEFVSLASHQLKTPLTIIKWYIEMLGAGYAGGSAAKKKEYFEKIYNNAERMVELVDAFLNVSRLELGVFVVQEETVNLRDKMELILNNFAPKIKEKSLKIERTYSPYQSPSTTTKMSTGHGKRGAGQAPSGFEYTADAKMIQIIFENLVSNAIKYTPPRGRIQIKISRRSRSSIKSRVLDEVGGSSSATAVGTGQKSGPPSRPPTHKASDGHSKATDGQSDEILIEVIDTGIGIPANQQSKIFSKFFRADNAASYKTDGTGLGLYVVKSMVDKIGGKIWFKSPAFAPVAAEAKTGKKATAGKPVATNKKGEPRGKKEQRGTAFYVTFYSN